jgi:hypothetical protein
MTNDQRHLAGAYLRQILERTSRGQSLEDHGVQSTILALLPLCEPLIQMLGHTPRVLVDITDGHVHGFWSDTQITALFISTNPDDLPGAQMWIPAFDVNGKFTFRHDAAFLKAAEVGLPLIDAYYKGAAMVQAGPADHTLSAEQLELKYSPEGGGEHPLHTRADWRGAVAEESTVSGYWDWLTGQLEQQQGEQA